MMMALGSKKDSTKCKRAVYTHAYVCLNKPQSFKNKPDPFLGWMSTRQSNLTLVSFIYILCYIVFWYIFCGKLLTELYVSLSFTQHGTEETKSDTTKAVGVEKAKRLKKKKLFLPQIISKLA